MLLLLHADRSSCHGFIFSTNLSGVFFGGSVLQMALFPNGKETDFCESCNICVEEVQHNFLDIAHLTKSSSFV